VGTVKPGFYAPPQPPASPGVRFTKPLR